LIINGSFVGQKVTGQQRYAHEVQKKIIELAPSFGLMVRTVGVAEEAPPLIQWAKALSLCFKSSKNNWLITLTSRGPLFARNHVVVVHDIFVLTERQWFSKRYWLTHGIVLRLQLRFAKVVVCVSQMTAAAVLEAKLTSAKIVVAPNAASDIFLNYESNSIVEGQVLERFQLVENKFFLTVGASDPRKNIKTLILAHKELPESTRAEYPLILIGHRSDLFASEVLDMDSSIRWLSDVSDQDLAALYRSCLSFVMPSFAEGFGLPIVEALAVGADVVVNDIEVFRWVAGDSAEYVNCSDGPKDLAGFLRNRVESKTLVVKKKTHSFYSWEQSAMAILSALVSTDQK
jgi:glycosyltransferase involved in cell wall biosynthesis